MAIEAVPMGQDSERCCPQCGGRIERKGQGLRALACRVLLCMLLAMPIVIGVGRLLPEVVFGILFFLGLGLIFLSLLLIPIANAIQTVAQPRCQQCRLLCLPNPGEAGEMGSSRFPWSLALVNEAILLVFLVSGLLWLNTAPGLEASLFGFKMVLWIVLAVCILSLGLSIQTSVWKKRCAQVTTVDRSRRILLRSILMVGIVWLAVMACDHRYLSHKYDPIERAPKVLNRAGLAALPPSARDVKFRAWAMLCSGHYTLRFAANPDEIEAFLAESPGLQGKVCRTYSDERMLLRVDPEDFCSDRMQDDGNEYIRRELSSLPDWYQPEIRGAGRRYQINQCNGKYQGELLIDDERHIVYVHVNRG